jgi:hypothetical protein
MSDMGRQIAERIDPQIARELDILAYLRLLPPRPKSLRGNAGARIINASPIAMAARSQADVGFMRMSEMIDKVAELETRTGRTFFAPCIRWRSCGYR